MTTRVFFLNGASPQYGQEEMNQLQKFMLDQGILNSLSATWEGWATAGDLRVSQRGAGANMSVDVAQGWAVLNHTRNGVTFKVFAQSNATANVVISANASGSNRVDAIIMRVSRTADPNSLTTNVVTIQVVNGTGVSALSDGAITTAIGSDDFIRLANVTVANGASSIVNANIADTRVRAKTTDQVTFSPTVLRFRTLASDPAGTNLVQGDVWYNSTTNLFKYYNGSSVITLTPSTMTAGSGISTSGGVISIIPDATNGYTVPTGAILPYSARIAPTGYLLCNGAAVSRTTYATLFAAMFPTLGTVTITIATPGVVTLNAHGLLTGDSIYLTTTGALPTGLTANTRYWVIKNDANSFWLATSLANALAGTKIATSGSQSGTHTMKDCPHGLGDGSTTFNVPDLRGKSIFGKSDTDAEFSGLGQTGGEKAHTLTAAELPEHTHTVALASGGGASATGISPTVWSTAAAGYTGYTNGVQESHGGSHNNLAPYGTANFIVKV